jgi:predicted RNase H-like HicB family nuclease
VKLQVVLEPSEEGGYSVYVPSLPLRSAALLL